MKSNGSAKGAQDASTRTRDTILPFFIAPLCVGCVAALLAFCANHAFSFFEMMTRQWQWWPFVTLPLGGLALTFFIRKAGTGSEGSGIQQAIAALFVTNKPERLRGLLSLRIAAVKFIAIVGGLFSGFVLGLEGPTVQIGASIFHAFRRSWNSDSMLARRQMIMAGGAAGIAAAFNAPIAGVVFAFEEMIPMVKGTTLPKLIMGTVFAGIVVGPLLNGQNFFGYVPFASAMPLRLVPVLVFLALAGGIVGGAFSWLAIYPGRWLPFPEWRSRHPYLFVLICGLVIAMSGLGAPIFGSGAELTREVLAGNAQLSWQYLPLKFVGLLTTFLTGLPGGIFSPSLSIGAGLGSCFLPLVDPLWQKEFIAIGMMAVLAAVTRARLTTAVIMMEMTSGWNMALPALGATLLAAWAASFFHVRFYRQLAERLLPCGQSGTR